MRFKDKVALITGSGRGIGRAIALRLAADGADIVVNFFRNRTPAEDTAEEIRALGRKVAVIKANVGDLEELENLFAGAEEAFGGLDIFISNAASGYNRPVLKQKAKGWDWTMNINARSLLFGAQHATRLMKNRDGGAIVSLSSPGASHPLGIRVNAVSPGVVRTDALEHFDVAQDDSVIKRVSSITPAGRLVTPDDVADLVAFLCSQEANMIRGQTIVIDGGFILLGDQSSR